MKKVLCYLAIVALGFTSAQWAFAAPAKMPAKTKPINAMVKAPAASEKSVSKEDRLAVEADFVEMQKDGVKVLRGLIDTYVKKDAKETGNMKWQYGINEGDTKLNVEASIEKYVSILSYLQGKQEFGAKGTVKIGMSGKRYDYSGKVSENSDGIMSHPQIDINLQATIQFDGNVKIIGKDLYFTLAEFKKERTGSAAEVKEFDDTLREIDRYVGKTYKVSNVGAEMENPNEIFKQSEAVFQILETKSLVEAVRMKGDAYVLQPKKSTLQAINLAVGKKKNDGLNNSHSKEPIEVTYKKNAAGGILKVTSTKNKKNYALLTRENGEYTFEAKNAEMNRRYKTSSNFEIMMKRDFLNLKASDINSYSSNWFAISWQENQLAAKLITQNRSYFDKNSEAKVDSYEAKGPLDIWTGNMDLKFMGNGKEYGNLMIQAQPTARSFKFNLGIEMGTNETIKINGEGSSNFEKGTNEISTPTNFEEIKNFWY